MKPAKLVLYTATMIALGGIYGCSGGDDTTITIDAPTFGGGTGGSGSISQNCPDWAAARPQIDGVDVCQLPATILVDRELTSDIIWFMESRVTVGNGNKEMSVVEGTLESGDLVVTPTLTIEPGTDLIGKTNEFASLVITRGAKIMANGTAEAPIIFSSDDDDDTGAGEWGGIILQGYAPINLCTGAEQGNTACNVVSEGESEFAGGYTPGDSSGEMEYVIINEGGYRFAEGNEINGLSLVAVGSGTVLDYIQINGNADDGIEFYGGTVNAKHLVLTGNQDDSLDWDEGWTGNIQYLLSIQDELATGSSIEADTRGTNDFASLPTIANATFIGDGTYPSVFRFKDETGGFLLNVIADVKDGNTAVEYCVDVEDDGVTEENINQGELVFNNVIVNCPTEFGVKPGVVENAGEDDLLSLANTTVTEADPQLDGNYQPLLGAADGVAIAVPTFNGNFPASTADDAFLDDTDYIGALEPGIDPNTLWYVGWTLPGTL